MTRSIVMYRNNRNNNTISFPSPIERVEKKVISFVTESDLHADDTILYLTRSGSISLLRESGRTRIIIDTDRGTKTFLISSSANVYEKIRNFTPEHCPGYDSDIVNLGEGIKVYINHSGISVVFNSED